MKFSHGAWFYSFKQISKGTIKNIWHTIYKSIENQMDNQSNIELQFNLNVVNVRCTQVHKTKYSMNM